MGGGGLILGVFLVGLETGVRVLFFERDFQDCYHVLKAAV